MRHFYSNHSLLTLPRRRKNNYAFARDPVHFLKQLERAISTNQKLKYHGE